MVLKSDISLPLSRLEVIPLCLPAKRSIPPLELREKDLPPTPRSARLSALEYENDMLRGENQTLRRQLELFSHQLRCHKQVADAGRNLVKEAMSHLQRLQDSAFAMKRAERAAKKELSNYATSQGDRVRFQNDTADGDA